MVQKYKNIKNIRLYFGLIVLTVFVLVASLPFVYPKVNKELGIVVKVGNIIITDKDVAYKIAVERAYGNETITDAVARQVITRETTEQEVARSLGVLPTETDIATFSERVNKTTKAPELLAKVKNVFGADIASYQRVYLLPKMVNITLHSAFATDKGTYSESLIKIEKAYAGVIKGRSLEQTAKSNNLEYVESDIKKSEIIDPLLQKYFAGKELQKPKLLSILPTLKSGEIYKEILEDENSYQVVRLAVNEKEVYKVEMIVSRKRSYGDWYDLLAKKIPITLDSR